MAKPTTDNPTRTSPRTGSWPVKSARSEVVRNSIEFVASLSAFKDPPELIASAKSPEEISLASDAMAIIAEVGERKKGLSVNLPTRMSVSTLVNLAKNPDELALNIRRPMPNHIDKYARRGTDFHLWLENHFQNPSLISMDDLFNQSTPVITEEFADAPLEKLQQAWLSSEWANKQPVGVEVGFETMIDNTLIRGRIDAVYQSGDQFEVVDWKTGKVKDGDDLANAAIQLAMYRLAYSKLKNVPIEKISAAFHYVADNQTVRPADILDEQALITLISKIPIQI